ncbi:MAG: hypothetical protein ACXAE3_12170 [Candidatus Kariarchaeaceae archaeon]|jgi:hypothetical protein
MILLFNQATTSTASPGAGEPILLDQAYVGEILSLNATGVDTTAKDISGRYDLVQFGDGKVSEIWEGVTSFQLTAFGEETGSIASFYGSKMIYFLLTQNPIENWISIQWDTDGSSDPEVDPSIDEMDEGDDLWVFGLAEETLTLGDAHCVSFPVIAEDASDDLSWERILVNDSDGELLHIAWEIKRPLVSEDIAGSDVLFTKEHNVTARFASSNNHKSPTSNNIAKFVLSGTAVGGNVTVVPPVSTQDTEKNSFIPQNILIGGLIGVLSYTLIFIPTIFILKRQEVAE